MRFKNQLPDGPSSREDRKTIAPILPVANTGITPAGQSTDLGQRLRSHLEIVRRTEAGDRSASCDNGIRIAFEHDPSWCSTPAARFRVVMKAIGGIAARGEAAFESVLLAAMSWTITQVLAGCAEYCQAMYPTFVEPDGPVERHGATGGLQSDRRVANEPACREIGARGSMMQSHQTRLRAPSILLAEAVRIDAVDVEPVDIEAIDIEALARSGVKRAVSRRWRASITLPVAEFWLRLRHERERRRAIMELRALEHRTLRPGKQRLGHHCE